MKTKLLIIAFIYSVSQLYSQSSLCAGAEAFCSDAGVSFQNTTGVAAAENGPFYGCLNTQPNPAWYFIRIGDSGTLSLNIAQNSNQDFTGAGLDVDYICYGPFTELQIENGAACNDLTAANEVDCSYSGSATETLTINGAVSGDYYILLITNFENASGYIEMNLNPSSSGSTDCSILESALGDDLDVCEGTEIVLDATPTTGAASSYQWEINTGAGFSIISGQTGATLTIGGSGIPEVSGTIKVRVFDIDGNEAVDEVAILYQPIAKLNNSLTEIELCDTDNDAIVAYDLTSIEATLFQAGEDPNLFDVTYFTDAAYTSQVPIGSVSNFDISTQTIYIRAINKSNADCFSDTSIDSRVYETPVLSLPADLIYTTCDTLGSGSDTDGLATFSLTESDILPTQNPGDFTFEYYSSNTYAPADLIIFNVLNFENTIANTETVYVKVYNNSNIDCEAFTEIQFTVDPLPNFSAALGTLTQCDDASNDGEAAFNLTQVNDAILQDAISTQTFLYYETEALAIAGVVGSEIINPTTFLNQDPTTNSGAVWLRVVNDTGCWRVVPVDLVVKPIGAPIAVVKEVCDDFLDAAGNDTATNDDTDGITTFDFLGDITTIENAYPAGAQVVVSAYLSEADMNAFNDPIAVADYGTFRNTSSPNTQIIWVRVDSNLGNECLTNGTITLTTIAVPSANGVSNLVSCDTLADGDDTNGFESFDLSQQSDLIRSTGQSNTSHPISYHESFTDAQTGANALALNHTNTTNPQTIFVRMEDVNTGCVNTSISFNLEVQALPVIDTAGLSLEVLCDDDTDGDNANGIGVAFDLGALDAQIINQQTSGNYSISYYETLANADAASSPLAANYENTSNNQSIFIRVVNQDTNCVRTGEVPNLLVVSPIPVMAVVVAPPACDDDTDGDDTNGSISWDLSAYDAAYIAAQNPPVGVTYSVTYHTSLAGATDAVAFDEIADSSAYANVSNPEQVYVRITDVLNGCFVGGYAFDLFVQGIPDFDLEEEYTVCDNLLQDSFVSVTNPDASDYDYRWYNELNELIGGEQILYFSSIDGLTSAGVFYSVEVINPNNGCSRSKQILIKQSGIANLTSDSIITTEFNSPSNSITLNTASLGAGDYEFSLLGNTINYPFQDDPVFTDLIGGSYLITVRDKNGCGEVSLISYLLDYPRFLTPNGDGENDTWNLIGIDSMNMRASNIRIFDRFGKLIKLIDPYGEGWDGMYNKQAIQSTDYWFVVDLTDSSGNVEQFQGHFSLVRR